MTRGASLATPRTLAAAVVAPREAQGRMTRGATVATPLSHIGRRPCRSGPAVSWGINATSSGSTQQHPGQRNISRIKRNITGVKRNNTRVTHGALQQTSPETSDAVPLSLGQWEGTHRCGA
ncbi:MAG: hypothetical protein WDW36_003162 [Sanguina aurantia]